MDKTTEALINFAHALRVLDIDPEHVEVRLPFDDWMRLSALCGPFYSGDAKPERQNWLALNGVKYLPDNALTG